MMDETDHTTRSYASATGKSNTSVISSAARRPFAKAEIAVERKEEKFWECRCSLRLWPVPGSDRRGLVPFLKDKLRMDQAFVDNELGDVEIKPYRDPRSKTKDEIIARFETKEVRDAIKASAPSLANFREEAGMRLHLPNHLQKDFKSLMSLSYGLKQKHNGLKRNVKFDEEDLGLYMDIQMRIKPEQARKALSATGKQRNGPAAIGDDELTGLLG